MKLLRLKTVCIWDASVTGSSSACCAQLWPSFHVFTVGISYIHFFCLLRVFGIVSKMLLERPVLTLPLLSAFLLMHTWKAIEAAAAVGPCPRCGDSDGVPGSVVTVGEHLEGEPVRGRTLPLSLL